MNALALTPARIFTMPERAQTHDFGALRRAARHDKSLPFAARVFFEDVCDLSERDGFCSAGQAHFAERYGVDERTVRRWEKALEKAGYLIARRSDTGDERRRRLTPNPASHPEGWVETTGHLRPVSEETTGHSAEIPDISRHEIPDISRQAPRVNTPPEGEREARAREDAYTREGSAEEPTQGFDPVAEFYAAYPGVKLNWQQEYELRARCLEPEPFRAALRYWVLNDHIPTHVAKLLDRYRRIAAGVVTPGGLSADAARADAGPDPSAPLTAEQRDALVARHPALTDADFYAAGKDHKTGLDLFRLMPAKRRELAPTYA